MKRWYCFLVAPYGSNEAHWTGIEYVSDEELLALITHTKATHLGMSVWPFVYSGRLGTWLWDPRSDVQVLASMPVPGYVA